MGLLDTLGDYLNTITGDEYIDLARSLYNKNDVMQARVGGYSDAFRHLLWTAEMARKFNPTVAKSISDWHENVTLPGGILGTAHPLQTEEEKQMDLYNNALGIEIGKKSKSYEDTIRLANEAPSCF